MASIFATALSSALVVLAGAPACAAPRAADVADNAFHFVDPGAPPPFNPADYSPYLGAGSLTFGVHLFASLKNGQAVAANADNVAYLYPDTSYTRWMLEKYAFLANGNNDWQKSGPNFPGQGFPRLPGTLTASPMSFSKPGSTAVHATRCRADGICVFSLLRPGSYIFFGQLWKYHAAYCQKPTGKIDYEPVSGVSTVEPGPSVVCGAQVDWGVVVTSSASYKVTISDRVAGDESLRVAAFFLEK